MKKILYLKINSILDDLFYAFFKNKKFKIFSFNRNNKLSLNQFLLNCSKKKICFDIIWINFGYSIDNSTAKIISKKKIVLISKSTGITYLNFDNKK